jgi:hypothetical protein
LENERLRNENLIMKEALKAIRFTFCGLECLFHYEVFIMKYFILQTKIIVILFLVLIL